MTKGQEQKIIGLIQSDSAKDIREGLRLLYAALWPGLKSFLASRGVMDMDVEDIFQDAMIATYEKLRDPTFTLTSKLNTYTYTIAFNLAMRRMRRTKRRAGIEEAEAAKEVVDLWAEIENDERKTRIQEVLERIDVKCRKILRMFYYNKFSMAEIAKTMGYANGQVAKNKKASCMKKLREIVGQNKSEWM